MNKHINTGTVSINASKLPSGKLLIVVLHLDEACETGAAVRQEFDLNLTPDQLQHAHIEFMDLASKNKRGVPVKDLKRYGIQEFDVSKVGQPDTAA